MKQTNQSDDQRLLDRYVSQDDERCFRELVDRHLGMVLGCAQRAVGDRELAQEVAQNVFVVLAKKGGNINPRVPLGAWLHRATVYEATRARRKESLRKDKMSEFAKQMDAEQQEVPEQWNDVVPLIDAAVDRLSGDDRQVVVLRFFEGRTYGDIGERVGKSDEAIRKQVTRALTKLSRLLSKAGVAISGKTLGAGLSCGGLEVIPGNALVSVISANAVSSASVPIATATMLGLQKFVIVVTALAAILPVVALWGVNLSYAQEVDQLEAERLRLKQVVDAKGAVMLRREGDPEGVNLQKLYAEFRQLEQRPHEVRLLFRTLALIYRLSEEQLPAAFEMLQSSPLLETQMYVYEALFARWAQFNPQKAIERTKEVRWHGGRLMSLEGIIKEWVVHDPKAALAAISKVEMGLHQKEWIRHPVVAVLVAHDPEEAAAQFESASGALRSGLLNALSWGWTKQDPEAALAWAAGLEGEEGEQAFSTIMSQLSKQEPIWALETLLASEETSNDRMLRSAFVWWVQIDVEGAMTALIDKVPEELRTELVIDPFCYACSGVPVEKVLEWAEHLPDENVANKFLSKVAGYRPKDIPGALRLLEGLPESRWREQAVSGITSHWVSQNVAAAEEWLESLPLSLSRDAGAKTLSMRMDDKDPRRASAWAARIQHPEWRADRLERAMRWWKRKNRGAASNWLENSKDLSSEERKELRNVR